MKALLRFEDKVLLGFGLAVLVVAGLTITMWFTINKSNTTSQWVTHTYRILNELAWVRVESLNTQIATQNFLLTKDPMRLIERRAAIESRDAALQHIRNLTYDNPGQQARLMQLNSAISLYSSLSRQIESIYKDLSPIAVAGIIADSPLQDTSYRVYKLIDAMEDDERNLLEMRAISEAAADQKAITTVILVALLFTGLISCTFAVIRIELRESQRSRQALVDSEENLNAILYSIGDAVLVTDAQGRIVRMNLVAEALTGWNIREAQGWPIEKVFHIVNEKTRLPVAVEMLRDKIFANGKATELAESMLLVARDGTERLIANSIAPIRNMVGRIAGVVLVFRDETASRKTQRLIKEQNTLLEQRVEQRTAQLRESEEHLRSIISNVPAMIAFVDAQQRYVYANQQYMQCFAPGRDSITGCTVQNILGEDRYATIGPLLARVLRGEHLSQDWEPFPDVWLSVSYVPKLDAKQAVNGYYVLDTDISERKRAERQIARMNADLAQHVRELEHVSRALRTLSASNRSMLRASDEQDLLESMCREIVFAGSYRMACVWYCMDTLCNVLQPVAQAGHPGGLEALSDAWKNGGGNLDTQTAVASAVRTGKPVVVRNLQDDPAYAPWRQALVFYGCCVANPLILKGKVIGALAIYSADADDFSNNEVELLADSTDDMAFGIGTYRARAEQEATREAMVRMSLYDHVTGLPNETQFSQLVAAAIDRAAAHGQPFAVMQANVDRLRQINEALGFANGDELLKQFGARLRSALPEDTVVARLRGDEFAILLPESGVESARRVARKLETMLAMPFPVADLAIEVSAKIGIVLYPDHGTTLHDLLRHVDIASNLARKRGLRHVVFHPERSNGRAGRLTMVSELRHAIEANHLMLYLQPKVDMRTGRACGSEGLVRWRHAKRGMIPSLEFIGLAEQTTLIRPLTEWVIETALRLIQTWQAAQHALPIAINLSASNLRDDALLEKVCSMQRRFECAPGMLEMELTESMLMDDAEDVMGILRGLRAQDIPLYIDDFGTGYSSLSYLQRLPVDCIKIDRAFVSNMLTNEDSAVIVRSTIDLAHDLGRKVVAEGVETQAQWERLAEFGCDIAQGYVIAAPMPPEQFPSWCANFGLPFELTPVRH